VRTPLGSTAACAPPRSASYWKLRAPNVQTIYILLIKAVRGRLSFRVLPFSFPVLPFPSPPHWKLRAPNVQTIYILLIKAVRGRLSFRVLPFSFPVMPFPFPPAQSILMFCHHFFSVILIPCSAFLILPAHKAHSPHLVLPFSSPLLAKHIPIPTYIPCLAKIKLKKTQMAPRGFEPVTPQANVLVATTTSHVCLRLHLLQ
jgi:hypothetical protein